MNKRPKGMLEQNKYYFLIKLNKIFLVIVVGLTIILCWVWSFFYKNFEFYCEAFKKQLDENYNLTSNIDLENDEDEDHSDEENKS